MINFQFLIGLALGGINSAEGGLKPAPNGKITPLGVRFNARHAEFIPHGVQHITN